MKTNKKWLFDKGKSSGSRKRYSYGGDFSDVRNTKEYQNLDELPPKSSMVHKGNKLNRLSFGKLYRFLNSKVGTNWDVVFSEIKERIPNEIWEGWSYLSFGSKNFIEIFVSVKVEINPDGSIVDLMDRDYPGLHDDTISYDGIKGNYIHPTYYVHPDTNLLSRLEPRDSKREKKPEKEVKTLHAIGKTNRKKRKLGREKKNKEIADKAAEVMKEKKHINDLPKED